MCNMGKSRVHHSVKFRLDLNRTLPLLTLVSTSPDKPICCGPCQLTKQPPPAHRKKKKHSDLVPSCLGSSFLPRSHLTPSDPCHTRSWHILPRSFPSPQRSELCGVFLNGELNTERPPDNLGGPVPIYTASRWCLSIVWQEGVLSNCVKPHIVKVDKESLLSSWYKGPGEANQRLWCVAKPSQLA